MLSFWRRCKPLQTPHVDGSYGALGQWHPRLPGPSPGRPGHTETPVLNPPARSASIAIWATFCPSGRKVRADSVLKAIAETTTPSTASPETQPVPAYRPSVRLCVLLALGLAALSLLAYGRALFLPFIADDYLQVQLARRFGPISGWPELAADALYRCRTTSLVLTYWTERAFGLDPLAYRFTSLVLHVANAFLVFALGTWRPIGWRISALAAGFFAISQRHSEAVIWYAALPELLVLLFSLGSLLCWIHWLQSDKHPLPAYAASFVFYALALLSKESGVAVLPLCLIALLSNVVWYEDRPLRRLWGLAPFALAAGGYFIIAFLARQTHQHFNDGTFSLGAPFLQVMLRSATSVSRIWGLAALVLIAIAGIRQWRALLALAGAWIAITLLPYSFLTYMPIVPSRHTYFASVGSSLVVAAGLLTLRTLAISSNRKWVTPLIAAAAILHQSGYLWTVKHRQYAQRAAPTEELVRVGSEGPERIYVKCFPYTLQLAELAVELRLERSPGSFLVTGAQAARHPEAIDFCNDVVHH